MKKIIVVLLLSVTAFSCLTTGDLLSNLADAAAEKTIVAVVSEVSSEQVKPAEAEPAAPVKAVPTEQNIIEAVEAYDLETLSELLSDVDDVKTIVGDDVLLLHLAEEAMGMTGDKNEMLALLVEKKAYILQRDENGKSFDRFLMEMEMAGTPRHEFILEILGDKFQRQFDAIKTDSLEDFKAMSELFPLEDSLLITAVKEKAGRISAWIIDGGISADIRDPKTGEGLLHIACNGYPYNYAFDGRTALVDMLLDAGADVNLKDNNGETPIGRLFLSALSDASRKMGSPVVLAEKLLDAGADANQITATGYPLLKIAVEAKLDSSVAVLLEKGAVINESILSANNLSLPVMKMFINYGADPAVFAGKAGGFFDNESQHEFIVYLVEAGVDADSFDLRQVRNNLKSLAFLVGKGADINADGVLMSSIADFKGMENIEYLIANGADLNQPLRAGMTALHFAVKYRRLEVASYLVEQGAELNLLDDSGKTPLDYCDRNKKMLEYLTGAGAKSASEL